MFDYVLYHQSYGVAEAVQPKPHLTQQTSPKYVGHNLFLVKGVTSLK